MMFQRTVIYYFTLHAFVYIFQLHLSNFKHIAISQVYFQLESLSCADPPYKSVAALNCIILGCANIWDLDRAYQTFEAISSTFGLTPDIHSYNALMQAFGKLKKVTFQCLYLSKTLPNHYAGLFCFSDMHMKK